MAEQVRMTEDELLASVEKEEANCVVHYASLLSEQRRKAIQYYDGQPYGNEVEGRSQVVTTEVKDAVEGILPTLMKLFTAGDEIVRFDAQKPEDEEAAQQATDYVNYIFSRLNNGFLALYCLFKDALLLKNGYVKVYWEDWQDVTKEHYENLSDMEFQSLLNDDEVELVEHTEKDDPMFQAMLSQMPAGVQLPQQIQIPKLHDAVFRRTKKHGEVRVDPLPPEEVLVSRDTLNDIKTARFVEHRTLRSLSDIREMGYEIEDDIADYAPNADFNMERVERNKYDDALAYRQDSEGSDPSTKRVWLCEAYFKIDYDGDGIAELRKVTKVGKTILDNIEFDSLPIISGTAILMPHKHYGRSLFDLVGDLQLQKSTVLRQLFDNAYVANNGRMEVLEGMVNMADLLTVRPNGLVRVKAMGSIKRIDNPLLGAPFYSLLEYLDKVKQNRIGSTDFPNAVDPDGVNSKAAFVDAFKEAAQERINLMARILGETAVKEIFWKILELVSKHQDKRQVVKLRGKWIEVNPREWKDRFQMTVTVGIGTGSQQTTLNGAMGIMNIQQGMLKVGLGGQTVTAANAYHAAHRYAKSVFPKDADLFFSNPKDMPPPQQKPDYEMLDLQLKAHKLEVQDQQKKMKMQFDAAVDERDKHFDMVANQFDAMVKAQQEREKHQSNMAEAQIAAMTQLRDTMMQGQQAEGQIALKGMIDGLLQQQEHHHAKLEELVKGAVAVKVAKAKPKQQPAAE